MKRMISLAVLSASTLALSTAASFADYTLNILHINDLHSRIEAINKYDSTCSEKEAAEAQCFGGIARVKTKIDERRDALKAAGENVIVLDAGDQFQGSLFYTTYKGKDSVEFMNAIGFDAMAVGNHEFDDGPPMLAAFLDEATFPVISGNTVVADAETDLAGKIKENVVLDLGGERVGILSVIATDTDVTASPGPNVTFQDEIEYLKGAVARLEADGINKIVLLSHVGFPRDQEIAAAVDGIDVIVGGHSHTLLSNTVEGAQAYPTMVSNPSGQDVPIVQAYAYSKYVGELKVVFDDAGVVTSATGDTILLDSSVTPDATLEARVKELAAPIEEVKQRPVSTTTAAIDGNRDICRTQECSMGNLVADAMLDRTRNQGVTIAIQNGGGLRASIDEGEITMGEVLTVLPFQNSIATFQMTGADLKASIEMGLSEVEEIKGKFPQVAGLRYTFDMSVAPNEGRLQSIETMEDGAWVPLDDEKVYSVVTNNFMRGGGDGYKLFATNAQNAYDFGPSLEDAVAEYLAANNPYTPVIEGRITVLASAEAPVEEAPAEPAAAPTAAPADDAATKAEEEAKAAAEAAAAEAAAKAEEEAKAAAAAAEAEAAAKAEEEAKAAAAAAEAEAAAKAEEEAKAAAEAAAAEAAAKAEEEAKAAAMKAEEEAKAAAAAAEAEAAAAAAAPAPYVIVRGDNYWNLSRKFYGRGAMWRKLQEANPDYNPLDLPIGASLVVPAAD
ncbi:multifunctional 2',3'-cyclic-nucleotide 2'-phosphodiesterase/5'-nucleotidase/3'-nucleotidase [Aquibium carbonis]|uniref:Multifunctional 2',3'-cyclic-nucleotide 2'-phosphodiesterase/5'-nucleotidase/3'-nucleotidase n=1 Tax=Aquibium carbonis TaxID=2495581 RepID=A0A3R9ZPW3_9HYPH|nr:bifunctional metallophosphatase/5'-nucleotidase [Aquibium carbonis]RST84816.1 multifunctional 2',3'-cyclic-nucleotide 2'-phosphodiesterase/5'-nucleotidase/3'-nucleotidase [Aquibium carbonis]